MSDFPWHNPTDPPPLGIHYDMSDRDYHALPAMRWSTLSAGLNSARALNHRLHESRADSPALRIGRAVHLRVLQPKVYAAAVAIVPDEHITASGAMSSSKAARAWREETATWAESVISPREAAEIQTWARLVDAHDGARELLARCTHREVTAVWTEDDGAGGSIVCKARADMLGPSLLADLKTWSPRSGFNARTFGRECWSRNYHAQLGFYARGFAAHDYTTADRGFLVVNKGDGGDVGALICDGDMNAAGDADAVAALDVLRAALRTNTWEGAMPGVGTLSLPAYAYESDNNADSLGLVGLGDA
jgi:hypothetical protein